ncbi:nucleotide-binding universal stress UspA family protein [Pseudomonas sp. BIGb0408]|uniref:Nucleotide-binding universal stress UspA family protein n=1 Tax=Phytopseudomonas flavescens TaxID=29435 RepID=A0A7Y9XHZ9_9GAMM|nr:MULTISPECIES: universal stress protein [Pseudomonas]MCW2293823.1 nucleotide-binding universal stress UspA family protein [Pseudomonas sp. BIGb0408]NYH71607.1 nucleotide-binding universal stress UspA family protein [Pseudomonas flavescens]
MSEQPRSDAAPVSVLLATDLSVRCDRALDRAAQLAGEWQAMLVGVNVLETGQAPDLVLGWASARDDASLARFAEQRLQEDLAGLDVPVRLRIERGEPVQAIAKAARETGSALVVTGVASNELWGRLLLGSTVESLIRQLPQPLLVVRQRPRGRYQRILVATDFSDSSRHALHAAARYFPDRELVLYHATEAPMSDRLERVIDGQTRQHIEEGDYAAFLAASDLPEGAGTRIRIVIEQGSLGASLSHYVREHAVDLVVMGTHGRSGLMNVLLGSAASELLQWVPCDTLVVREPRAGE